MQVTTLPDKVLRYGGGLRYRPFRGLSRFGDGEGRADVHISLQASIAITRAAPVIEVMDNEKAAEEDPRGRIVDIIV